MRDRRSSGRCLTGIGLAIFVLVGVPAFQGFAPRMASARDRSETNPIAPDLVRAMCEGNSAQLLPVTDRVIDLLGRARDSLAHHGSVAELVEAGHAARTRYDSFPRSDIVTVMIGAQNWREELAAAGRAGGVIRSALPILDSPR